MKTRTITEKQVLHLKTGTIYTEVCRALFVSELYVGDVVVVYTDGTGYKAKFVKEFDEDFEAIP